MGGDSLPVFVFGCMSCGKTVSGREKSCPRCGASFEDVKFECPFCGELISPGDSRCATCGTEFSAFAAEVCEASAIDLDGQESSAAAKVPAPESVEYECPECGKRVSENDAECPNCGARFA